MRRVRAVLVEPAALRTARAALAGRAPGVVRSPAGGHPGAERRPAGEPQESGVLVHPARSSRRNRQQA